MRIIVTFILTFCLAASEAQTFRGGEIFRIKDSDVYWAGSRPHISEIMWPVRKRIAGAGRLACRCYFNTMAYGKSRHRLHHIFLARRTTGLPAAMRLLKRLTDGMASRSVHSVLNQHRNSLIRFILVKYQVPIPLVSDSC